MKTKDTKIIPVFVYHGCGFPVTITDAPMKAFRNDWFLDIDPITISEKVLFTLAASPSRLTGEQVKFIRLHFAMNQRDFAKRFGVTHPAVVKWEAAKGKGTGMDINTERVMRIFLFMGLGFSPRKTLDIVMALNAKQGPKKLEISAHDLKAA